MGFLVFLHLFKHILQALLDGLLGQNRVRRIGVRRRPPTPTLASMVGR